VVEEYVPDVSSVKCQVSSVKCQVSGGFLFVLSAKNEEQLKVYAQTMLDFVEDRVGLHPNKPDIGQRKSKVGLQTELVEMVAGIVGVQPDEIEVEQRFAEYGLDQVQLSWLRETIAERYQRELPVALISGQSTVTTVAGYLEQYHGAFSGKRDSVQALTPSLTRLPSPDSGEGLGVRVRNLSGPAVHGQAGASLAELTYTLQVGREAMEARLAFVVEGEADLRAKLGDYLADKENLDAKSIYRNNLDVNTNRLELLTGSEEARDFIRTLIERGKLADLAQLWVEGIDIDWSLLYGADKPSRISLPTYPFEKKRYWIPDSEPGQNSISAGPAPQPGSNQLLYIEETWLEKTLPVQQVNWVEQLSRRNDQRILVIYEDNQDYEAMWGLLENIETILQDIGQTKPLNYRFVRVGEPQTGSNGSDGLNKTDQVNIRQWVQGLKRDNQLPEVIFFMQALTPNPSPDSGEGSRASDGKHDLRFFFYLAQAFMKEAAARSIQGYYLFADEDAQPRLDLEAMAGLTRSIVLETPNHRYKTIRVESTIAANQKAVILFNEWLLENAEKPGLRVRYQGLHRSVSTLREIKASLIGVGPAFRQGGVYLITGGLGEIGQPLCEHLARTYHATLIILARSQLTEPKKRALERIEQAGGQVWYDPVDLADRRALRETMVRVKERVDRIDGVIHLARWVEDGLMVDKKFEAFERVMAAKVDGTIHLDEVTREEPLDFFMVFSSLAAYGIKGSPDYAYASAFQNAFAQWRETMVGAGNRSGRTRSICWGQWAMDPYSDDERNRLLAQMGFGFLTLDTAQPALAQSLAQDRAVFGAIAVSDQQKIKALLGILDEPEDSDSIDTLFDHIVLDLRDDRKNKEETFRRIAQLDLTRFSDQQIEVLYAYIPNGSSIPNGQDKVNNNGDETRVNGEMRSTSTDLRTLILTKLKTTLKLESEVINPRKTFQDYGLDSITGMKLAVALQQSLGVEVLPRWLIDYPTVDSLAEKMREIKQQEGQNI